MIFVGAYRLWHSRQYRMEGLVAAVSFCAYLVINAGYFMWWGGYSFGPRHLTPMLPFLCLLLIFVPRRYFPILVILTILSTAQMLIVTASTIHVPDDYFVKLSKIGFFDYSAIYSYCLQKLTEGKFAWNVGQSLFGLKGWLSLLPIILLIAGSAVFMALYPARLDRSLKNQPSQPAS